VTIPQAAEQGKTLTAVLAEQGKTLTAALEKGGWRTTMVDHMLDKARRIADDVLFPAAARVDTTGVIPAGHLDLLAQEGFYGLAARDDVDGATFARIVETLASGCLATTFVWLQHHSAVTGADKSVTAGVRGKWFEPLRLGQRRAGVSQAGVRPGPSPLAARRVTGGYILDGEAPWVTGWGMIDTLRVAARDGDTIVWALLDTAPGPTLGVTPLDLVAVAASHTVHLRFDGHFVPDEQVTGVLAYSDWAPWDAANLGLNGYLALGVAVRCCRLIGRGPLNAELDAVRVALDTGTPQTLPAARAAAAELALRAAATVTVTTGSRAVLAGAHGQRLVREATFLLVFGSRPTIRAELLRRVQRGRNE
jgi:alkylation response protein AidB-like acyl-CoA dehydrogenase